MDLLVFVPLAIAVVTGLTQLAKGVGLEPKLAPLVELVLGIAFVTGGVLRGAVLIPSTTPGDPLFWAVLYGCITGLSAAGLYTDRKTAVGA